jgi:integrase
VPEIQLLKENPPRNGFLKKEKFDELVEHIPDDLKAVVTFLYYCGGRRGEVFRIKWSQVDLDGSDGLVFPISDYYLRKHWDQACEAVGLGGGRKGGLIVHDLRRSAARNLRTADIPETVIMRIGGWKTESVFRRYNIVDEEDVIEAMRTLEAAKPMASSLASRSESLVRVGKRKLLKSS